MKNSFNLDPETAEILLNSNFAKISIGGKVISKKELQEIASWKLPGKSNQTL